MLLTTFKLVSQLKTQFLLGNVKIVCASRDLLGILTVMGALASSQLLIYYQLLLSLSFF